MLVIVSGTYRHRVTIQKRDVREDDLGQTQSGWSDVFSNISALVEDLSGRELLAAQEIHSTVNTRIRIRYRPSITADMRVIHKGRNYNIETAIRADNLNVELILLCSAGLVV